MSEFTIPRVTVLTGHTDAETAYVVDDYPYGRGRRCKIRYWVETSTRKANMGDQRFVSQTTDPRRGHVWNKPKASTYSPMVVMFLNEIGHVKYYGVPIWIEGASDTRIRVMGAYDALTDDQRTRYDAMLRISRKFNANGWEEWAGKVALLAAHIRETGADPELKNQVWEHGGRLFYLSDPAAYVTAARALIEQSG